MSSALVLLLVVGGYLASQVAFDWMARRFNLVSGIEYLVLGLLLGPQVSGVISASVVDRFAPVLTLALGWIGVSVGARFHLPARERLPNRSIRIAVAEAVVTLVLVTAAMATLFRALFGLTWVQAAAPAVVFGAVGTASSPTAIALAARRLGRRGPDVRHLQLTAAIDAAVAIVAFGLLLSIVHAAPAGRAGPSHPVSWVIVSVFIGLVGGAVFHLFLRNEQRPDRLFIGLAGAVILASGAAAYLRLSPLLPSMLIGLILVNTSPNRREVRQVLASVERPLYFVLLIFAGAAWVPGRKVWVVAVAAFLAVRTVAKLAGAASATLLNGRPPVLGGGWGWALLGQGGIAVAIALNYQIYQRSELAMLIFTAAIASVLVTDMMSARIAEAVVRSARRQAAAEGGASRTSRTYRSEER